MNELEKYFQEHPDEETEFIEELARLYEEQFVDIPEDYRLEEVQHADYR